MSLLESDVNELEEERTGAEQAQLESEVAIGTLQGGAWGVILRLVFVYYRANV